MKSLHANLVWRVASYMAILLGLASFALVYVINQKSRDNSLETIEYIRDTKFTSLNKDNLQTAFVFSNTNYLSYILDDKGEMMIRNGYKVDNEIKDLCALKEEANTKSYQIDGITKYVAIRKNGSFCFVVEGNDNQNILLATFVKKIVFGASGILLLLFLGILYRAYRRIYKPIKTVTDNAQNALISKWEGLQVTSTKIHELGELDKYVNFLIDVLKQKKGNNNYDKAIEVREAEGKFLNKKYESEANKFKLAVDSAVDVVVIVDRHGYIIYANKALTTLTGLRLEEVENKKITELWHKNDDPELWKGNYESVAKDKKPISFNTWGTRKDNLKFEGLVQITPIKGNDDSVESFLVVERDVTEEKQKERIKNEFISVVSHELRTPMSVIRGYSALLAEGKLGELNEKQKEYVDKINQETGQLLELANDMLDIQKFESGKIDLKLEATDMTKFVKNIVDGFVQQYANKGLKLLFENNLSKNFANIDPKYFARVVTNMLTNAYKYTEQGEVKVFLVNPDKDHIVIAVKDTGVGIKEEALNHLFERFYQADGVMQRKQEGSGLGLSIVKTVSEAHQGMVWVESKVGVGSTFYVAIPTV